MSLLLCLFFIICILFIWFPTYFEVMDVTVSAVFLLVDKKSHLLWVRWCYFFADEDVGERLMVEEKATIWVGQQKIIIEFPIHERGVFDLWQDIFEHRSFFIIGENATILE